MEAAARHHEEIARKTQKVGNSAGPLAGSLLTGRKGEAVRNYKRHLQGPDSSSTSLQWIWFGYAL